MMHRCSIFLTNDGPLAARGRRAKPKFLPKFFSLLRSLTRFSLKQPPSGMSVATRTGRNVLKNTLTVMTTAATSVSRNHKCCAWGKGRIMKKLLLMCALCMTFGLASDALGQGRGNRGERRDQRYDRRDDRNSRRRGNGYYRRGTGSPSHPVFGDGRRRRRNDDRRYSWRNNDRRYDRGDDGRRSRRRGNRY